MQKVKYAGVSFIKKNNKYSARVRVDGKSTYIGSFDTAEEASKVREEFAKTKTIECKKYTKGITSNNRKHRIDVEIDKLESLNRRYEKLLNDLENAGKK